MNGKNYPTIQLKRKINKKLLIEFSPTITPKIQKTEKPHKLIVSKPTKKSLEITHRNNEENENENENNNNNNNKEQQNQEQKSYWVCTYNFIRNSRFKQQNRNINNREESKLLPEFHHFEGNLEFIDFVPNAKYYYYFVSENVIPTRKAIKDRRLKILGLWDARDVQRFRYYPGTKNIYTFIGFETKEIREEAKNGKRIIHSVLNKSINNYPYEPYESNQINKTSHIEDKEENEYEYDDDEHNKIITQNTNDDQYDDDDEIENESESEENESDNKIEDSNEDDDDFFSEDDD